ncbi:PIG-L deacetylase family protein [Actinomadura sp. 7K507]|uniref:PIG-L deacetylase family protein n=1 Tax=Actinomadura sp. 7K507 TaxID=2530365 RepID=UPI00104CDCF8|nr:PIG-L deacetylase family protein [Actinomadura sp. 7K507]TDC79592.1 PIG-L family deacetylase [Actinomadura sp. 7K507]
MSEGRTLAVFHAHPDDEALLTAGTMARAAGQGHRVVLVVATDGELGQTRVPLTPDTPLGLVRRDEVRQAARLLGVHRLVHLGYADSGAGPAVPADPPGRTRFVRAPLADAAARLADVLREEGAEVLITDDEGGGYGHRDHRRAHRVGAEAARLARTPRVLEATMPFAYSSPRLITHRVDVRRHAEAKRAALRAHVSQSSPTMGGDRALVRCLRLPAPVFRWVFGHEWFIGPPAASAATGCIWPGRSR